MPGRAFTHFVFVDFENVPSVDLGLVAGKEVHVSLLIGKKQTKLDLSLVQQIHRMADQVELVEVGASGHNALDLTLAFYLGQAVQRNPGAQFTIVSRDKDFEPMLGHLSGKGIKVARHDAFAAAFQSASKKPAAAPKPVAPAKKPPEDRLAKLIESFKGRPQHCPKKRTTLLHHIATFFGNKLSDPGVEEIVTKLIARGVISIDDKGKVAYR
jgi:hypothetical protein